MLVLESFTKLAFALFHLGRYLFLGAVPLPGCLLADRLWYLMACSIRLEQCGTILRNQDLIIYRTI
jgi:hypothetical protein